MTVFTKSDNSDVLKPIKKHGFATLVMEAALLASKSKKPKPVKFENDLIGIRRVFEISVEKPILELDDLEKRVIYETIRELQLWSLAADKQQTIMLGNISITVKCLSKTASKTNS